MTDSAGKPSTGEVGARAESIAERWLAARGLRTVCRNYRWRGGEIDLVMRERHTLAIIEVRYRQHSHLITPEATVNGAKRRRLIATTQHLLARRPDLEFDDIRFDVLAMSGALDAPTVRWLKRAFTLDY